MKLSESTAFIMMCVILLRTYARHTKRRTRIVLISLGFVAIHLIHNLLTSEPLILATSSLYDASLSSSLGMMQNVNSKDYASAKDATLVIFYNLFLPPDGNNDDESVVKEAIDVIKDQMGQVSSALYRLEEDLVDDVSKNNEQKQKKETRGVVFYNSIGNGGAFPPDEFSNLCRQLHPRLDCRRMRHYNNATESVTLTSLHEFCSSHDHDDDSSHHTNNGTSTSTRVAYLHSKGSFHAHEKQRPWRRELTASSLHPNCINPPDDACDVCGAQHYTVWGSMFPGNMWTAKCSYVRKLLPPVEGGEYEIRREASIGEFFLLRAEGVLQNTLAFHQDVFYGLDRYQWEHWVGSHPSLVPCELHSPRVSFWDMVEGRVDGEHGQYEWGMGPRRSMVFDTPGKKQPYLIKDEDSNFRQYYYLAGNLIKWLGLYDTVPTQDSWVWDHFPAGQRWKELVDKHGKNAIDAMVRSSNPRYYSAFTSSHSATLSHTFDEEALSASKPPIVVFYHITYPSNEKEKAVTAIQAQFNVLSMGRYDNAAKSFDRERKILLYYTIAGVTTRGNELVSQLCKKHSDRIICKEVGMYDTEFASGETLRQLHTFCNANPSSNAIYITNQLADVVTSKNRYDATKVEAATLAVVSKMCHPSEECNVCGTEFYPLPFVHFTGNMFSTSCAYAKDLLPPKTHEKEMRNIAGDAFLAHLRKQTTTELLEFTPQILGMQQHSIEHWIGGHPELKPCDVAPTNGENFDRPILDRMKHYSMSLTPRRGSAPPGSLDDENESRFRLKREISFREYYYLAGNVFRWHLLYGRVPDASGWAWQWFPDGQLWEVAARTSGVNAVKEIAKQLGIQSGNMEQFWVE